MPDPLTLLRDGGPFMYALLLFGMVGMPFAVLFALAIGAAKARLPASIGWTVLTGAALVGALGTWMGTSMTTQAAASASPEMRMALIASGLSVSLYTTFGWMLIVGFGLVFVAGTAWLTALLAPGPSSHLDTTSAGAGLLGGIVGATVGALVLFVGLGFDGLLDAGPVIFVLPPIGAFCTATNVVASLRVSEEPDHRGRIAATRVFLGTTAFLGIALLGEAYVVLNEVQVFQALAVASTDMRGKLLEYGLRVASYSRWVGWAVALPAGFTGWASALPHLAHLGPRQGLGVAIAGVQILVLLLCLVAANLMRDLAMLLG